MHVHKKWLAHGPFMHWYAQNASKLDSQPAVCRVHLRCIWKHWKRWSRDFEKSHRTLIVKANAPDFMTLDSVRHKETGSNVKLANCVLSHPEKQNDFLMAGFKLSRPGTRDVSATCQRLLSWPFHCLCIAWCAAVTAGPLWIWPFGLRTQVVPTGRVLIDLKASAPHLRHDLDIYDISRCQGSILHQCCGYRGDALLRQCPRSPGQCQCKHQLISSQVRAPPPRRHPGESWQLPSRYKAWHIVAPKSESILTNVGIAMP